MGINKTVSNVLWRVNILKQLSVILKKVVSSMLEKDQNTELKDLKRDDLIEMIHELQGELEQEGKVVPMKQEIEEEHNKINQRKEVRSTAKHIVSVLIVVAAISVLLSTMFFPILKVSGVSMEPTLENGQIIVLEKSGNFETGDLIGFYYQNKILLKRVIGQAGDYIDMDASGNVYVNNVKIDEPYIKELALGDCEISFPYQVPDGKIFVLGDNRKKSVDSRSNLIGCISEEQIVGRVMFRIWPLNSIGFLN